MEISPARRPFLPLAFLLVALLSTLASASVPVFKPRLQTQKTAGEIDIDGRLGDDGWTQAGRVLDFIERSPGDNVPPLVRTEAMITYDDDYLYVAFLCHDDPAAIRATMCQRDEYDGDDAVGLMIDTFGDGVWAYEFFVNPYGIQKDVMWTSVQGEDRGFDMVWEAAAHVTEQGYTAEIAIPLAGLRFPDGEVQNWRVDFWRIHPRDSYHQYSWSALDRNEQCFPCQWGTVEGIEGVQPGKGLEFLPSFISYRSGRISDRLDPESGIHDQDVKGELSLGMKYSLSSDVTMEATINPDFSQIEADADQIDVNTPIVQRFAERRPFFQEGSDLFRTHFNSFYTRTVNAPELAAKGTARWDRTSLAYVLARDELSPYIVPTAERSYSAAPGKSTVNVLRGLQSLGNNSQLGFMVNDRRYEGNGSNTILSGDWNLRLGQSYSWVGQFIHSMTTEPDSIEVRPGLTFDEGRHTVDLDGESYSGQAVITEVRRRSRGWNFTLDYNELDTTYQTQTGYDPWNAQRNAFAWTNYNWYTQSGLIERVTPQVIVDARWFPDGRRKWGHLNGSLATRLRWAQTFVSLGGSLGEERWGGVEFKDLWGVDLNLNARPHDKVELGLYGRVGVGPALGTLGRGDETQLSLALNLKPIDRLILEPTLDYVRSEDSTTGDLLFEQTIARARLRLQVNPRLSLRLVMQHNDALDPEYRDLALSGDFPDYHMVFGRKWEVDPLLTYRINSFSVFYLGSTHDFRDFHAADDHLSSLYRQTGRQYFMKIQYLLQV